MRSPMLERVEQRGICVERGRSAHQSYIPHVILVAQSNQILFLSSEVVQGKCLENYDLVPLGKKDVE